MTDSEIGKLSMLLEAARETGRLRAINNIVKIMRTTAAGYPNGEVKEAILALAIEICEGAV